MIIGMTTQEAGQPLDRSDRPQDTFELRLLTARHHAGLKPGAAAALVGVTAQSWRNWEAGRYTAAARKPSMLAYIAARLRVNEEWLRDGGPLAPPSPTLGYNGDNRTYHRRLRPGKTSSAPRVPKNLRHLWVA